MNHEVVDAQNPEEPHAHAGGSGANRPASGPVTGAGTRAAAGESGSKTGASSTAHEAGEGRLMPFSSRFRGDAGAARSHAFKPGAYVAGKVVDVRGGVARVDLFGKAVGFLVDPELAKAWTAAVAEFIVKTPDEGEAAPAVASESATEHEVATDHEVALETDSPSERDSESHESLGEDDVHDEAHEEQLSHAEAEQAQSLAQRPPFVNPGDMVRGIVGAVAECGHVMLLPAAPGEANAVRAYLRHAKQSRGRVPGLVFGYNRGGFDVWMGGLRAFCPVRGLSLDHVEDPHPLLGMWQTFHVQEVKSGKHRIVVSRRTILERERRKLARRRLGEIAPGDRVRARVVEVRDDSLRVEFDGIPGRIYYRELGWAFHQRPADFARLGDLLDAEVLRIPEPVAGRKFRGPVELTLRHLQQDPWHDAEEFLVEGLARSGSVLEVREPGAVIALSEGIDGWLPSGEFPLSASGQIKPPALGESVHVVLERVDARRRRIALSWLAAHDVPRLANGDLANEAEAARDLSLRPGQKVKVRVEGADERGVRVRVIGKLGRRGRAFMRPGDTNTRRGTDLKTTFPCGIELEVKIVLNDRDGGLLCSLRALEQDEERQALREFNSRGGGEGLGTFADLFSKSNKKK